MNCPLCIDQTLEPNHRGGIEIDVCPKCRGIWLDRGEIDRLAPSAGPGSDRPPARSAGPIEGSEPPGPARDRRKKRRKSLGERLGEVLEEALDL